MLEVRREVVVEKPFDLPCACELRERTTKGREDREPSARYALSDRPLRSVARDPVYRTIEIILPP